MPILRRAAAAVLVLGVLAACSGSTNGSGPPVDVAGVYSISLTNGANGCDYDNWTVGGGAQNIEVDVTQNGASASADVKGLADIYFAALGIGTLTGTVSGGNVSLSGTGTNNVKKGNCAFFVNARIDFSLSGDAINGSVTYTDATNHSADCGVKETCTSQQTFAGSRPPK